MKLDDSEWMKIVKGSLAKGYTVEVEHVPTYTYTRGRSDDERKVTIISNPGKQLTQRIEAAITRHNKQTQ